MTIEKIKRQLQRANEAAAKLEADKEDLEDLTNAGCWALGYWQGQISILEALLKEI